MRQGALQFVVAAEEMVALPEMALYWPAEATLFVADLHLGKGAAFRAAAYPVPEGSTAATLQKLSCLLETLDVRRLVLLGDLWHSKSGRDEGTVGRFGLWRKSHAEVEMQLVAGNHDLKSGPLEGDGLEVSADPVQLGPFICAHHPQEHPDGYLLSGHIHPAVRLEGKARLGSRCPCFWFGKRCAVLPAFGELTGTAVVRPTRGDQVLIVADGRVLRVS